MSFIKRLFKKWEVVYTFRTLPNMVMKYNSQREAEKDALFIGFKLMKKSKMEVNFSEKQIRIS